MVRLTVGKKNTNSNFTLYFFYHNHSCWFCIGQYMRLFTPVKIGTSIWWQAKQGGRVNRDFDYNSVVVVRNDCKKEIKSAVPFLGRNSHFTYLKFCPEKEPQFKSLFCRLPWIPCHQIAVHYFMGGRYSHLTPA